MIRVGSSEIVASGLVATPRARSGASVLRRITAPTHGAWFWVTLWALAAVVGFVALMPAIFGQEPPIPGSEVVFRLVGVSFTTCGLIAWRRRPDSDVGRLMAGAGFGIFVYPVASQIDSAVVLTLGTLFASVWTIAFTALILSFVTGGRLVSTVDRVLVAASFFALFVLQFVRILFADYPDNVLLVVRGRLDVFNAIGDAQYIISIAVSLGIVVVTGVRWRHASPPARRALLPSVAGCLCSLLFSSLLASYLLTRSIPEWLSWVTNAALLTVPAVFLAGMLHSRLARGGLAQLFRELSTLRGEPLQRGLAKSLGDPSLVLAYRAPNGYVDVHGAPLPATAPDRATSPVEHDGRELGLLIYDPLLDDDPEMVQAVTAAAAIALDNDRIQAEAEASLAELRASRERIVTVGDAERRRLERDLHDGAQQRLVALSLRLSMLQRRSGDDPALAEQLAAAGDEVAQSLEELRELAHGIHPAVLNYGLGPALESLASRSVVPTSVSFEDSDGLGEQVEMAAYFVACEALANIAKYAQATRARMRVSCRDGVAVIEIADDGIGGADASAGSGLRGLADRVGALDGTLRVTSPPGAGTVVTAEIPCV